MVGLSIAGPKSREVLQSLTRFDMSNDNFRFMDFRRIELGMVECWVGRMTYTGDLGYEIWVTPEYQRNLFDALMAAGEPHGIRLFGVQALLTMRLEKMFGTWFREYRPIFTPYESRMDRYIKLDHEFVGRAALEAAGPPQRYSSLLRGRSRPDRPRRRDRRRTDLARRARRVARRRLGHIGRLRPLQPASRWRSATSRPAIADDPGEGGFEIEIIGRRRPATLLHEPVLDPGGTRMRS